MPTATGLQREPIAARSHDRGMVLAKCAVYVALYYRVFEDLSWSLLQEGGGSERLAIYIYIACTGTSGRGTLLAMLCHRWCLVAICVYSTTKTSVLSIIVQQVTQITAGQV